eukprot:gene2839-5586_t
MANTYGMYDESQAIAILNRERYNTMCSFERTRLDGHLDEKRKYYTLKWEKKLWFEKLFIDPHWKNARLPGNSVTDKMKDIKDTLGEFQELLFSLGYSEIEEASFMLKFNIVDDLKPFISGTFTFDERL